MESTHIDYPGQQPQHNAHGHQNTHQNQVVQIAQALFLFYRYISLFHNTHSFLFRLLFSVQG